MSEDLHPIDQLFKEGMDGRMESPSAEVWDHIAQELDSKEKVKPFAFFRSRKVAAALLIGLASASLFAGGYLLRGVHEKRDQQETETKQNKKKTIPNSSDTVNFTDTPASNTTISDQSLPKQMPDSERPDESADRTVDNGRQPENIHSSSTAQNSITPQQPQTATPNRNNIKEATVKLQKGKQPKEPEVLSQEEPLIKQRSLMESIGRINMPRLPELSTSLYKSAVTNPLPIQTTQHAQTATANIPVVKKTVGKSDLPRFAFAPIIQQRKGDSRIDQDGRFMNGAAFRREVKNTESQEYKLSVGLLADLRLSRSMTFQSGIVLTSKETIIQPKPIRAERKPDGSIGYRLEHSGGSYFIDPKTGTTPNIGDTVMTALSRNKSSYTQIPLNVAYHLGNRKVKLFAMAGVGVNILAGERMLAGLKTGDHDDDDDDEKRRSSNLHPAYFNGTLALGINVDLTRRIGLMISPQHQFALTSANNNSPVRVFPKNTGVQAGLQIKF